jgi:MscS family membrane protein
MNSRRCAYLFAYVLLNCFLLSLSVRAADDAHPLRPVDTSSPRASLHNFITSLDAAYIRMREAMASHLESGRLYLNKDERRKRRETVPIAKDALQSLDFSGVLPILQYTVPIERAIQLKEVLDRIELPAFDDIPDREAMERRSAKKWRLPDTEIDFVLIESGPRAGSYIVSAETVERIPEFYERVKSLPYKPGPARQLNDTYRAMSGNKDFTIYDAYASSPVGLDVVIPPRWMLSLPNWAKMRIAGMRVWQWLGFAAALAAVALFILGLRRLAYRLAAEEDVDSGLSWTMLVMPLLIMLTAAFVIPRLYTMLRISGMPLIVTVFAQTAALYLSAAWLSFIGSGIIGEAIADSAHLRRRRLDSQLIRLGTRFAGIVIALGFLIQGANELGFPAYSVVAGLGVGGVAVALAARDSLANLFGSMLIMFEKPFRVGDSIRIAGSEGTVEDVGFRSTRIRTVDNSLVSIPNNTVVNTTIENLTARVMRRQRFFLQVTYDTDRAKIEEFAGRIEHLLSEHPATNKNSIRVRFNEFGESSLNILVQFNLEVADAPGELKEREDILFQIMEIARQLGVEFAFPTRTLHVARAAASAVFEDTRVAAR